MKKIIVVTGGAGFVGSNLIKYFLVKTNYNLISIDNYSSGTKKNHIKNKRIKYIKSDTKNIFKDYDYLSSSSKVLSKHYENLVKKIINKFEKQEL